MRNLWLFAPYNNPGWFSLVLSKIVGFILSILIVFFLANLGSGLTRANRINV
jgi:hypothetical protein